MLHLKDRVRRQVDNVESVAATEDSFDLSPMDVGGEYPADNAAPSPEMIRMRAYQLYLARDGRPGDAASDWLRAEAELLHMWKDQCVQPLPHEEVRALPARETRGTSTIAAARPSSSRRWPLRTRLPMRAENASFGASVMDARIVAEQ
jgi:hypothetical protein